MSLYDKAGCVSLVELNEKLIKSNQDRMVAESSKLLMFEPNFYAPKSDFLLHSNFEAISKLLYQDNNHPYKGHVSCVAMHSFKSSDVIFSGNSAGYIRAFKMKS